MPDPTTEIGNVILVPSHKFFSTNCPDRAIMPQVVLTRKMLLLPLYLPSGERLSERLENQWQEFLKGLIRIRPFAAIISLVVREDRFVIAMRDWGVLYFEDEVILNFTHDSKSAPFRSFTQWPQHEQFIIENEWNEYDWERFFFQKIKSIAEAKIEQAQKDQDRTSLLQARPVRPCL